MIIQKMWNEYNEETNYFCWIGLIIKNKNKYKWIDNTQIDLDIDNLQIWCDGYPYYDQDNNLTTNAVYIDSFNKCWLALAPQWYQ